jgi:hypothetical protein
MTGPKWNVQYCFTARSHREKGQKFEGIWAFDDN